MPHLTKLQKKYADQGLVVIGISDEQDKIGAVKKYVKDMGDKMQYVVAVDNKRKTYDAYMKAFNMRGIPHSFLIDKAGKIVWHDHPMKMDAVVESVMAGKFDEAAAKKLFKEREEEKKRLRKLKDLYDKYFKLVGFEETEAAKEVGEKFLELAAKEPGPLNSFAWRLLTDKSIENRDLDLAMRVAQAAYDACDGKDAAIVDTYARALFDTGKVAKAIEYQKKAIELCESEKTREDFKEILAHYEEAAKEEQ